MPQYYTEYGKKIYNPEAYAKTGAPMYKYNSNVNINETTQIYKLNLEDGIHSLKMLLPRCWFNVETTQPLINALRQYHRKYNEKMKMFSNKPVKDWSSHATDSARYMAMSITDLPEKNNINQKITMNEYSIHGE